jgi:hypothetical protein
VKDDNWFWKSGVFGTLKALYLLSLTVVCGLLVQVTRHFADVLVNYLVTHKLDTLKQPDSPSAKLVLQQTVSVCCNHM